MNAKFRIILILGAVGLALSITSQADTIYVDQHYGPGGNGTPGAPYDNIQAAIDHTNSVTIIVYPGTYTEPLSVNKSLSILGYDGPLTTRISVAAGGNAVSIAQNLDVAIQGLTISSGNYGVYQPTAGTLHLRNCILCGNTSHGIYIERTTEAAPSVYIDNCISVANSGSGCFVKHTWPRDFPNVRVFNTILIANARYGMEASNSALDAGVITLDYNDSVANTMGNYSDLFAPIGSVPIGAHSFSVAPDFVAGNACNSDFRLLATSVCRNAGQPGIGWLDPDGTRNDIGAYGGPGAATFYTDPNDGPIIRNVTIDQGMVPRGSTFTIRAKGTVR